jgi:hypothetical protein
MITFDVTISVAGLITLIGAVVALIQILKGISVTHSKLDTLINRSPAIEPGRDTPEPHP